MLVLKHTASILTVFLTNQAPAKGTVGTEIAVEVSFTNPLKVSLTHCYLEVEGPGLTENQRIPQG